MALKALNINQYVEITTRLIELTTKKFPENENIKIHKVGLEYTSIMTCFRMHMTNSMLLILKFYELSASFFPTTNAYLFLRSMFEIDINAHYITKDPQRRAKVFIDYGSIISKRLFDKLEKHKNTSKAEWKEFITAILKSHYYPQRQRIVEDFENVKNCFEFEYKQGRKKLYSNWANKTLYEMAKEVDHEIEYDFYYSKYSNFVHGNVKLADRFLKIGSKKISWSRKADEPEIAFIFRDASAIFGCFLSLLGKEWNIEINEEIEDCWKFDNYKVIE